MNANDMNLEPESGISLPASVRRKFVQLEERLFRVETALAVCLAVTGLLFSWLLLFISDRFWETPVWGRLLLFGLALGALSGAGALWAGRWLWWKRNLRDLAKLVQRAFPRLGDRLLGIVELSDEVSRSPDFSPALYRAAIRQVSAEAEQFDFSQAVPTRKAILARRAALSMAVVVIALLLALPVAGLNAFQRWAFPWAGIERITLVEMTGVPEEKIVAHGEPFEISAGVSYRSFWRPTLASLFFEGQRMLSGRVQEGTLLFAAPGQVSPGELRIRVGDATRVVRINPVHRPALRELRASVQFPDYLRMDMAEEAVPSGLLNVVQGSRVAVRGETSRPLEEARLLQLEGEPRLLDVIGPSFSTEEEKVSSEVDYLFQWRDQFGLENPVPWRLRVKTRPDSPPVADLPDLPREVAILETEVIEIRTRARDDFGVSDYGLSWKFAPGSPRPTRAATTEMRRMAPTPHETTMEHVFTWSPSVFRIPPDTTIEMQGYARDFLPNREASETSLYRIHVMGVERHAELLRQRLEAILARLEEVTRLEERIAYHTGQMTEMNAEELDSSEAEERIESTQQDQELNARELDQLAREGMKTLREAFRNPTLGEETLQQWAQAIQMMQQLAQSDMPEAAGELSQARNNPDEREEHLADSLQKQLEILEALEQLQKNVNQSLDQLQALTLAQRLRRLAAEEREIGQQINLHVPETIGMLPHELSEGFKKINQELAERQSEVRNQSELLRGEISRFHERTQQPDYGKVSQDMEEARTGEQLDSIRSMIGDNISMQALQQLIAWSERFNEWADQLERKDDQAGGGGDGGAGDNAMAELILKHLMALLRMRESEINLRERTRLLDSEQPDRDSYAEGAAELASAQQKLMEDLSAVQEENVLALLAPPLEEAKQAMSTAGALLEKPQTDLETRSAQNLAVEMLSDAINLIVENQSQGGEGEGEGSTEMTMAFLLQMMALQPGETPGEQAGPNEGGNLSGGTTDRPSDELEGSAEGRAGQSRAISRTTGAGRALPGEFRDVLENYYRSIEQETK